MALTYRRSGLSSVIVGALFAGMGAVFWAWSGRREGETLGYLFMALGSIVAINGLLTLRTAKRFDFPAVSGDSNGTR
jgi:hypothetical protein